MDNANKSDSVQSTIVKPDDPKPTKTNETEEVNPETLNELFDKGLELYHAINNTSEPTNSEQVQADIKSVVELFEKTTRYVSICDLFSTNERLEEISNNDVKFLLLPALLAMLTLKRCNRSRQEIVDVAEVYLKDFLKRCYDYGLVEDSLLVKEKKEPEKKLSELDIIQKMVNTRQSKIERFKEQKALENKLKDLKKCFDEDVKREYFITLIKSFIYQAADELKSIDMERPMLEIYKDRQNNLEEKRQKYPKPAPLRPVIITKNAIQKAVYGAGYPSLPVMTVDEFYDKRVRDGIFPDPEKAAEINRNTLQGKALAGKYDQAAENEAEAAETDRKEEQDDEEYLNRLRARDEMKDEHRRGFGNRHNRS